MKRLFLFLSLLITTNIFAQYYLVEDFGLKGQINKVSIVCYDIYFEDEELLESFPYSTQIKYKTDLNLHYLEFDNLGQLTRSKLYYPRDFYGQFSWIQPIFNLETSDYGEKINYLTLINRYKYKIDLEDQLNVTIFTEDGSKINLQLDEHENLLEDEYYTYTLSNNNSTETLTKRRIGSQYGYRRLERTVQNNSVIEKEYINNRFLTSKKSITTIDNVVESIFISQSRIELYKEQIDNDGKLLNKVYVNLNWKNKFLNWPEIDFDTDTTYLKFLEDLKRTSAQFGEDYIYNDNGQLIQIIEYRINNSKKILLQKTEYKYMNNLVEEIILNQNLLEEGDLKYKKYSYDEKGNWITKVLGIITIVNGETVRIPTKRYVKTLTYWD